MVKLTKRTVDALLSEDKDYFIWDSQIVGFGVRIRSSIARAAALVVYRLGGMEELL